MEEKLAAKGGGDTRLAFYIGPQIRAWKAGRRFTMEQVLDSLAVIFPFEVKCYADTRLPPRWQSCVRIALHLEGEDHGERIQHLLHREASPCLPRPDLRPDIKREAGITPTLGRELFLHESLGETEIKTRIVDEAMRPICAGTQARGWRT